MLLLERDLADLLDLLLDLLVVPCEETGGHPPEDIDVAVGLGVELVEDLAGIGLILLLLI